jgi:hypothetical protein
MSENDTSNDLVVQYKHLVERYEALNKEISAFLDSAHQTDGKELSPDHLRQYRDMQRTRDEVFSEMRALQQRLMADEATSTNLGDA